MQLPEIEARLRQTFEDALLSREEKLELAEIFKDLEGKPDSLRFARNRAFEMVTDHSRAEPESAVTVLKLTPLILALYNDTSRNMRDADSRIILLYMLSTCTTGAIGINS